jgi:agmatine/peptidylarginine deiminase
MRSYGPIAMIRNGKHVFIDPEYAFAESQVDDDLLATRMAPSVTHGAFQVPLVLDGGNFITDTQGIAYTTSNLYRQNIPPFNMQARNQLHSKVKEHLGVKVLRDFDYPGSPNEPKDGLGNIDSFVKLLSDDTVLISINNPLDLNEIGNKVANEFRTLKTSNRTNDNVLTLYGFFISGK